MEFCEEGVTRPDVPTGQGAVSPHRPYSKQEEICRWAKNPCQNVWLRSTKNHKWDLIKPPVYWTSDGLYVVDDEYAEIRKAFYDHKVVQVLDNGEWVDCTKEPEWDLVDPSNLRVKHKMLRVAQWICEVNPPNRDKFYFLSPFMTEEEIIEDCKTRDNVVTIRPLPESEKLVEEEEHRRSKTW
jgi:hypothetical protein